MDSLQSRMLGKELQQRATEDVMKSLRGEATAGEVKFLESLGGRDKSENFHDESFDICVGEIKDKEVFNMTIESG
jgi:hypothetical protein